MIYEILKRGALAASLVAMGAVVACSDDDDDNADASVGVDAAARPDASARPDATAGMDAGVGDTGTSTGAFTKPAGTVAVNFTIDDSANRVYRASDGLAWKGSFDYDPVTRIAVKDAAWSAGQFPAVFDDGAWDDGGHEPLGSTAGDNKWGITMFVVPDAAAAIDFEYGAIRGSTNGSDGEWIWSGPNGTFSVPAAATMDITVQGLVLPAFGTTDLRFTINTSTLAPEFAAFDPANGVEVKSSGWGWSEQVLVDNGMNGDEVANDRIFTFVVGENIGENKPLGRLSGLFRSGDEAQFVFVLGGVEYKVGGVPPQQGVTASVRPMGGAWTPVAISNKPDGDRNTFVVIP